MTGRFVKDNGKKVFLVCLGTVLAVLLTILGSFQVRKYTFARIEQLKKSGKNRGILLFGMRPEDDLGRVCSGVKARTVILLGIKPGGLTDTSASSPNRKYALYVFNLTGDHKEDTDVISSIIYKCYSKTNYPVLVVFDKKRSEFAVFLAAYRMIHDGWPESDVLRELQTRTGCKSLPPEVHSILVDIRASMPCHSTGNMTNKNITP